jgi:hypothetical protein
MHGSAVWRYRQHDMVGMARLPLIAVRAVAVVMLPATG